MLITKFNKLIRSRLLWAIVAVVVSVSFILSASQISSCGATTQRGYGKLFDETVTRQEFLTGRFFELGMRDRSALSPEDEQRLRDRTWQRLAVLKTGGDLGIGTSDAEIAEVIRQDPTFNVNGVFSKERYRRVIREQLRVPLDTFEAYIRQDLTIRKLGSAMESLVWVSPVEIRRRLANLTDKLRIEYAFIPLDPQAPAAEVSEQDALAYYEQNPDLFRVPDKLSVRYVPFPISNRLDAASVTDEAVEQYYVDHLEDYTSVSTNGSNVVADIEEVRPAIVSNLAWEAATFAAKDAATDFVMALAPDRYGNALDMNAAAAGQELTILTTDYFTVAEDVPGLDVGFAFKQAALKLEAGDPEGYFSDAVIEEDAVYVLATQDKVDAHLPDFSNIVDRVMPLAVSNATRLAFLESVRSLREDVGTTPTNTAFSSVIRARGFNVTTSSVFSIYEGMDTNEADYAEELIPSLVSLPSGQVSEPVETDGGALLAYVAQREMGDLSLTDFLRPQLLRTLNGHRSGLVFDAWGKSLLVEGHLEDYAAAPQEKTEEEQGAETETSS